MIDLLLNCACFIYIGAWLPFNKFNSPELGIIPWKLVVLFFAILALRRIPSLLLLYKWIPDIRNWREALFCGHFGVQSRNRFIYYQFKFNTRSDGRWCRLHLNFGSVETPGTS